MVIFALVIMAITLMCQRFWTLLRSQLTQGFQEKKEKDGEAVAPAEVVQGPIRLFPGGGDAVAPAEDAQGPIRVPPVGMARVGPSCLHRWMWRRQLFRPIHQMRCHQFPRLKAVLHTAPWTKGISQILT